VNRKLILLNVVLLVVVIYGGMQLWNQHQAAKARAAALAKVHIAPVPAQPWVPLANDPPVLAMGYQEVAQKDLFHPSRNPNIDPPPAPIPPAPPPMPELPSYYGQMNLGDGPMALLVEKPGMSQKAVIPGETIGQFKLVDLTTSEIAFAWTFNGALVRRSLASMIERASPVTSAAADSRTAQASAPPPPPQIKSAIGPGDITGQGTRTCDPNDNTPAGTVVNGFKKTEGRTPFGAFCIWDPVK
jgi:hypothetical protein